MKYKFLRPAEAGTLDEFESRLAELAMKVDRDFGSFAAAADLAVQLMSCAAPAATDQQMAAFVKLTAHFLLLQQLADCQPTAYLDVQAELNSYITGHIATDPATGSTVYPDHPRFAEKYPNLNRDELL